MMKRRWTSRKRPGFTLIEALMVATLLSICAAGVTRTWYLCYYLNDQARQMQAGKDIMEQEMERARRLNWTGLTEQTSYATRGYYDSSGNAVSASATNGYVSYIKVETMDNNALYLAKSTASTASGTSRSLRRVTIVVEPTGTSASASTYTAKAVTYMTLGGP
jgi:prepilin-type N-terminal cleavage/methylation domain-containing protein